MLLFPSNLVAERSVALGNVSLKCKMYFLLDIGVLCSTDWSPSVMLWYSVSAKADATVCCTLVETHV